MTAEQLKYMIALAEITDGKATAAKVARRFGVNRSTVSRVFAKCIEDGFLTKEYSFTFRGKNFIDSCLEKKNRIFHHMIWKGVPYEDAMHDALEVVCVCQQSTLDYLMQPDHAREKSRKRNLLSQRQAAFLGSDALEYLKEGTYKVSFLFNKLDSQIASMANEGFEHPGMLVIRHEASYFQIRPIQVENRSKLGKMMQGRLEKMQYQLGEQQKEASIVDDILYIPLEAFTFYYVQKDNILQGIATVEMTCTVGKINMPKASAKLTIYC